MRSIIQAFTLSLLSTTIASADVFDAFEDLQPVSTHFTENLPALNLGGETCCTGTSCTECCCVCPPAPTMIGDSLGLPVGVVDQVGYIYHPNFYARVADNNSAVPQNRNYFNFRYFNDVVTYRSFDVVPDEKRDLTVYEFGMERTLNDGMFSVDLLIPVSYSPDTNYITGGPSTTPEHQMVLQDIAFGFKALLAQTDQSTLSTGLRFEAPTRDSISGNNPVNLDLQHDTWGITPYVAALIEPTDDLFIQMFAAYRMQTTENGARLNAAPIGQYREPTYLNLDLQVGHWLYRNHGGEGLTALQSKFEIHYTGTYEPYYPQGLAGGGILSLGGEHDFLNLTAGMTALFNDTNTLTVGMVLPVREGSLQTSPALLRPYRSDRLFDWEFVLQLTHFLGS